MRSRKLVPSILALGLLGLAGCGYRLAARKGDTASGQTLAVPTFVNATTNYRIEQQMSEAVRKELARTTHYNVTSGETGDVIVKGQVVAYTTSPTGFDDRGRAAQYAVTVSMNVRVTESATGKTLLQNDGMAFRENFQISEDPAEFVPEDPAALERLAVRFASAVAASLVHRK